MSREIKFRTWDIENKVITYSTKELSDFFFHIQESDGCLRDWCKLMQFTGLQDKNGKDIYEGDILLDHKDFFNHKFIKAFGNDKVSDKGVVVFTNGSVRVEFRETESSLHCHYIDNWTYDGKIHDLEVIGNIHQNEDLLK